MLKISEKPCDFIVEDTPSLKFFIIPPPFSPSGAYLYPHLLLDTRGML